VHNVLNLTTALEVIPFVPAGLIIYSIIHRWVACRAIVAVVCNISSSCIRHDALRQFRK
jgi:hypothetical protein